MKPSSLRTIARAVRTLEAGMVTDGRRIAFAFRMRVRKSAIGSVIVMGARAKPGILPGGLPHSGDLSLESEGAEADATEPDLSIVRAHAAADLAARVRASLALRLPVTLDDQGLFDQAKISAAERHPELLEEGLGGTVVPGGGADRDVHPLDELHLVERDLREDRLLREAEAVVPAAVELAGEPAE